MATVTLITDVGREVPVSKKCFEELLHSLPTDVQSTRRKSEVAARKLAAQKSKVGELKLKVQFLADDVGKVGDLRKQLPAKVAELTSANEALRASKAALKAKDQECDKLSLKRGSA